MTESAANAENFLSVVLVAQVALAPLPFGSNLPVFWAANTALSAFAASLYGALLLWRGASPFSIRLAWTPSLASLAVAAYLVLQMLPLAGALGAGQLRTHAGELLTTSTISINPGDTWLMLVRNVGYALLFCLMTIVSANPERAERLLYWLFAIIAAYAALGLIMLTEFGDTLLFIPKLAYRGDATATFVNRDSFSTFLAFGVAIGGALLLGGTRRESERSRGTYGRAPRVFVLCTGMALVVAALLATHSRMGLFVAIAGGAVPAVLVIMRRRIMGRAILAGLAAVVFAALILLLLYGGGVLERFASLDQDIGIRKSIYSQVLEMIAARPWVGYGGGTFAAAYPLFHQPSIPSDLILDRAHSTYLAWWLELGLLVGTIPMLIVANWGSAALRQLGKRPRYLVAPLAALGVITVAVVHATVDFSLEVEANALVFLAVVAAAVRDLRDDDRERGGERNQ